MSAEATAWAWQQEGLPAPVKFVLLAIADRSDELGLCWPSGRDFQQKCGLSRSQIWRHIRALETAELLHTEHRFIDGRQTSNIYQLAMDPVAPMQSRGVVDATLPVSQMRTGGVTSATPGGVVDDTPVTNRGTKRELKDDTDRQWFTTLQEDPRFPQSYRNGWAAEIEAQYGDTINLTLEAEGCLNYLQNTAKGRAKKSVVATFNNWCKRAEADAAAPQRRRPSVAEDAAQAKRYY